MGHAKGNGRGGPAKRGPKPRTPGSLPHPDIDFNDAYDPGTDPDRWEGKSYDGALTAGKIRGRGSTTNPTGRYESVRLSVFGEHLDAELAERPEGRQVATTVREDHARTIINRVESPDIFYNWTINPYRGCEHGCIYCYARPGHEYFGLSPGIDFETIIYAKRDAARLLRNELSAPSWKGETIVMSGVTDPYQPVERDEKVTRSVLEVLAECRQSVSIITKSALILRDLDLIAALHEHDAIHCAISVTSLDPGLASKMEPRASSPSARLNAIRTLAGMGVPVTVMTAPIIPGINDHEMPRILEAAAEAGAINAGYVLLRLPWQNKTIFEAWLKEHFPDRAKKVESLIRQCRGGEWYRAEVGERFVGAGPIAMQIRNQFGVFARRHNLDRPSPPHNRAAFRRPKSDGAGQLSLF